MDDPVDPGVARVQPPMRVRPRAGLLWTGVVSLVVAVVPASLALYAVSAPSGRWPAALTLLIVLTLLCLLVGIRQLQVVTELDAHELRGNGIATPMVRVPLERVGHVHLVRTLVHNSGQEVLQLLVTDAEDRRLFRLRGNYWPPGTLERIAAALPGVHTAHPDPVPIRTFWTAHPGSAYWFENRPWVQALVPVAVVAVCGALAAGVMVLLRGTV